MKILAVVKLASIYHGWSTWKAFWEENFTIDEFTTVNMKDGCRRNVSKDRVIKNGEKHITLGISLKLVVWRRLKSHLQSQQIIWEDQERGWLPLWVSRTFEGQRKTKIQGMTLIITVWSIFQRLSWSFTSCLIRVMCKRGPNMNQLTFNFI